MATKKVGYKEPAQYFTPGMRKVAEEWEKEHAKDKDKSSGKSKTKKK